MLITNYGKAGNIGNIALHASEQNTSKRKKVNNIYFYLKLLYIVINE
jgi:hypothetical protein